jgi:hypothetical protein
MLKNIYQPVIQNGSGVNGNWDMSMIDGMMQIAVFTENSTLLSSARSFWKGRVPDLVYLNSVDGSNHAAYPRGNPSWFGQSIFNSTTDNVGQETCRDLRHMEDSISSTILAAETPWIQGGELYTDTTMSAATSTWTNTAFTAQAGSPTVKFNATPSGNDINTVVGHHRWSTIRIYKPGCDRALQSFRFHRRLQWHRIQRALLHPIHGGTKYSFWFQLNIPAQTYNVYVTPEGGSMVQIGANYAFRLNAPTLNNVTYHAEVGTDNVCSFNLPLGGN